MSAVKKYIGFIITFLFMGLFLYAANLSFKEDNQNSMEGRYIVDRVERLKASMTIGLMQNIEDPKVREVRVKEAIELQKSMAQPAQPLDKKAYMIDYFINGLGIHSIFLVFFGLLISTVVYFCNIEEDQEDDEDNALGYN